VMMTFHYENVEYEPEMFPGLVFRIQDPKIVVLLFATGNIILTGGKNMDGVKKGLTAFKEKMNLVI
jgi:transcription initiation factor TFIID TATA-box-binding protein